MVHNEISELEIVSFVEDVHHAVRAEEDVGRVPELVYLASMLLNTSLEDKRLTIEPLTRCTHVAWLDFDQALTDGRPRPRLSSRRADRNEPSIAVDWSLHSLLTSSALECGRLHGT